MFSLAWRVGITVIIVSVRTERSNCIHAPLTRDIMGYRYPEVLQATDTPSEITGESIKQYSRQTPVFFGGGDAREYPGGQF